MLSKEKEELILRFGRKKVQIKGEELKEGDGMLSLP